MPRSRSKPQQSQLEVLPRSRSKKTQLGVLPQVDIADDTHLQVLPEVVSKMDIAMAEDTSQLNIVAVTQLEDLFKVTPTAEDTQLEDLSEVPPTVEDLPQLDIAASSPLRQLPDTESHLNVVSIPVDDFDNRPSKKSKNSESIALDDRLKSPTISTSSLVYESSDEPLPPSPTKLMLSPVSELMNQKTVLADDDKKLDEPKHITITNNVIYDYLPQDYTLTELDEIAHDIILESKERDILVKIDDISIEQRYLLCLLDKSKWLDEEIISAYICCLKEQALVQNHNDAKIYFENPFVTRLLKQDGQSGRSEPTCMTKVVKNYLNYDMIHLPINIKDSHWYLACINVDKCEIQVLGSLCWKFNRADLINTLQGLQYHLDILINSQENLGNHKWKNLDVTKWTIIEQQQKPIQKHSSSCGLFLLKFMEYWTGHTLSNPITQEIITYFRSKLAAILLCWKNNTAQSTAKFEEIDYIEGDPNDLIMSDTPFDQKQSKDLNSSSIQNKYQSLMSVLSNLSIDELVGGLCNYIKAINSMETLEKVWIQSSDPYPISLTLKQLQEMLNVELHMDRDCFNLVVRKMMFDNIEMEKKRRGFVSKHYLDMQFWMTTDFGRHPDYRKKLDVEKLANSVRSWPGIKYSVSSCRMIHIPIQSGREFILIILDQQTKTVYILDPIPLEDMYQRNPIAKYIYRLTWISEHLPKAMSKACPGFTWNNNIFLWQQKIVHDISCQKREMSGYLVTYFMSTWENEKVHLPFLKDGYELRKQNLVHLLTFKQNECEDNMTSGVLDFINCIRKTVNNMKVKE